MPISPSPAVQRAGLLLWRLAEHPSESFSVSELARAADVPRATCDAILMALAEQGFVTRREGELRYQLGPSCFALADAARGANAVLSAARKEGDALARQLNACVVVSTVVGDQIRAIAVYDWGPPTLLYARVGHTIPLEPPFGVVFVAWNHAAAAKWLAKVADDPDEADPNRWHRALELARRRGYSYSVSDPARSELVSVLESLVDAPDSSENRRARDEVVGRLRHSDYLPADVDEDMPIQLAQISAPVFDSAGNTAASLMLLGPNYAITAEEVDALGRQLTEAANRATLSARDPIHP